jgi:hypothetical protein
VSLQPHWVLRRDLDIGKADHRRFTVARDRGINVRLSDDPDLVAGTDHPDIDRSRRRNHYEIAVAVAADVGHQRSAREGRRFGD